MKKFVLFICLTILLSSCNALSSLRPSVTPPSVNTPVPSSNQLIQTSTTIPPTSTDYYSLQATEDLRLTISILQNSEYHSDDWGDFRLVDGVYYRTPLYPGESPELYSTHLFQSTFGDLTADNIEDAAVILQTHNGGNGDSKELAIVLNQGGKANNISTVNIGSMIAVEDLQIQSGIIILDLRVHGPNDGLCCPSELVTWRFRLENNQLIRLP